MTDPVEDEYDDEYDEEDEAMDNCGLLEDGQCLHAGSEQCDFMCPMRDSEYFAGSKAWIRAHKK